MYWDTVKMTQCNDKESTYEIQLWGVYGIQLDMLEAQRALRLRQRRKQAPVTSSAEMIDQYLPMVYLVYKI